VDKKPEILPLTGLRGIAAALIVIAHYSGWVAPFDINKTFDIHTDWIWVLSGTPEYGMTLFFTLSGYLITFNYLGLPWAEAPLRSSVWFLWRRITRLYPALMIFLIWAGFTNHFPTPLPTGEFVTWIVMHLLSVETWIPAVAQGYLPMGAIFTVSWSVSTEIGMYLLFALALVIVWRARPAVAWAVILGYFAAIVALAHGFGHGLAPNQLAFPEPMPPATWSLWFFYQSPYFRVLQFAAGGVAAWLAMRTEPTPFRRHLAGAAFVCLLLFYVLKFYPGAPVKLESLLGQWCAPITGILFALIMLNATDATSRLNRMLGWKSLVGLGTVSYSLYLFHPFVPRMGLAWIGFGLPYSRELLAVYAFNFAFMFGIAIVLAYGMYHLVELPAQKALRGMWRGATYRAAPQQRSVDAAPAKSSAHANAHSGGHDYASHIAGDHRAVDQQRVERVSHTAGSTSAARRPPIGAFDSASPP
jgi:peptidoglycan/LPS O-acetylase OafA/YrhL